MSRPYHASLDTPLIDFGGEVWTIRDACEGTCIVGAPGSGKTSGSGQALAAACLKAGMGVLALCAKVDEAETWRTYARKSGRSDDLVIIDEHAAERFNILDFAAQRLGGPGFERNIVEVMERMAEAARVASPQPAADSGENSYFTQGAMKWLGHAFPLLQLAEGSIRLRDLNRFIATLPQSPDELTSDRWKASYCAQVHWKASERTRSGDPHAIRLVNEHGDFFLTEVPGLDNRPRSSIASTLTNLINPFLTGKLADLFCTDTTITPDACRDGAIIVLDLPSLRFGAAGIVAQSLFKYLFGRAMQSARVTDQTRPVLLFADEYQEFASATDADLLATARSSKLCTVFLTQDYPSFFAKLGEDVAKSMLGKFGTRVFHANTSHETNLAAAELIGKVQKFHVGESVSTAMNTGTGGQLHDAYSGYQGQAGTSATRGQTASGYLDYEVTPDHFATKLRTGAERNRFKVDGVVVRGGRAWKRTGRHWIQAEFSQR